MELFRQELKYGISSKSIQELNYKLISLPTSTLQPSGEIEPIE